MGQLQKLPGVVQRAGGQDAGQHPRDLFHPVLAGQSPDRDRRAAFARAFGDQQVVVSHGGQLRQVRHGNDLPRGRHRPQPLPPWQLGLALTAAAAVALFVVVSSWPAPAELILSVGATLARAAGSALDWLHTGVRLLGTLLDNVGGALAAIWTVVRAGTRAAAAAAGPLILPAAGATVLLQLLLWAMLRTRRDPA